MKLLSYIKFFFFHAANWNIPLAFFALYHTIRGEKKYQIDTFVASDLDKLTINKGDIKKASRYEAVNYAMLEDLLTAFRRLYPDEENFFDAGCGKGRAMVVAAHFGFKMITGVDFAQELCKEAAKNMDEVKKHHPFIEYRVICSDILDHHFTNETVIFLFNPFDKEVMTSLMENLENSVLQHPRRLYIIYASPLHEEVLLLHHYDIVYRVEKVNYLHGLIAARR